MQKFMFGMLLVAHFIYNPGSFYRTVIYKTSDKLITTLSLYKSNNYLHKLFAQICKKKNNLSRWDTYL